MRDKKDEKTASKDSGLRRWFNRRNEDFSALAGSRAQRAPAMPRMTIPRGGALDPWSQLPPGVSRVRLEGDRPPSLRKMRPPSLREIFVDVTNQELFGAKETDDAPEETDVSQEFSVETKEEVRLMPVLKFNLAFSMA